MGPRLLMATISCFFHLLINKHSTASPEAFENIPPTAGSPAFALTPFLQLLCISECNSAVRRSLGEGRPFKHSAACLNWGSHSCSSLLIMPGKLVNK